MKTYFARFRIETHLKKYKQVHNLECDGHSTMSVLAHIQKILRRPYYEILCAYNRHKIKIITIGDPNQKGRK